MEFNILWLILKQKCMLVNLLVHNCKIFVYLAKRPQKKTEESFLQSSLVFCGPIMKAIHSLEGEKTELD